MLSIGIIGYSGQKFNETRAKELLEAGFDAIGGISSVYKFGTYDLPETTEVEMVSGLTNLGIPALAYSVVDEINKLFVVAGGGRIKLVGVACSKAKDYECFPVDEEVIVGDNWGDESETFLNRIDALLRVGGGKQSQEEFAKFAGPKIYLPLDVLPSPTSGA